MSIVCETTAAIDNDFQQAAKAGLPAVLNQTLYANLRKIANGPIIIACEGESATGAFVRDPISGRTTWNAVESGEYYRLNCPNCNDTRQRLWINHLWGVGKREGNNYDPMWWAAVCYNEGCLSHKENLAKLRSEVWYSLGRDGRENARIAEGTHCELPGRDVDDPGVCVPLNTLPANHHAVQYVVSRGFNPDYLTTTYGVSYCQEAIGKYRLAEGRLVFPMYMDGHKVCWQCRFVGDLAWKRANIPKYYTRPGSHVKQVLYGYDLAKTLPFVIVVEGVTDVCAVGPGAVAIMGKTMSPTQASRLVHNWNTIVVMLDDDAIRESEVLYHRLLESGKQVVQVRLPQGFDPCSSVRIDPDAIWDMIYGAARKQGVEL